MADTAADVKITMPHKLLKGDFPDPCEDIWNTYGWERQEEEPLALFRRDGLIFLLKRRAYNFKGRDITKYELLWTKGPIGEDSFHDQVAVTPATAKLLLMLAPVVFPYAKRPAPKLKPDYS